MYEENKSDESDAFMQEFKFFKKVKNLNDCPKSMLIIQDSDFISGYYPKFVEKNLSEVIDEKILCDYDTIIKKYGIKSPVEWKCFELPDIPGLFVIQNPFCSQRFFVKKSLLEYPKKPNKTNLHEKARDEVLWNEGKIYDSKSDFNKLRWTTIGYHYDWTNKVYNSNDYNSMPNEINELAKFIAYLFGYKNYRPEAGIVNYYHLNSTLSAHQDHSELNQDAPLISISFGNPAIFLIGSNTKTVKPISILIKSGDIVIMTGKSRLAYHAVPKILEDKNLSDYFAQNLIENTDFDVDENEWAAYYKYISINRINLNIRQVF